MAWQEKTRASVAPFLAAGEEVQALVIARSAETMGAVGALFANPMRVIVVTDRRILLCRPSRLSNRVQAVLQQVPRDTRLGPTHGLSYRTDALGTPLEIGRGAYKEVEAADALIPAAPGT